MVNSKGMTRSGRGERGNSMLEFALVASFLIPVMAGVFTVGMSLVKGIQAGNVSHDANILMVRGIDMSQTVNQQIVVRTAQGFSLGLANGNPDPNGPAVVILTQITYVGDQTCAKGVTPSPPSPVTWSSGNCPNYHQYVIASRIYIGNSTRFTSQLGNPSPNPPSASTGLVSAHDIAMDTSDQVANCATILNLTLQPDQFSYVSEAYFDISYLNIFNITAPILYVRNLS
jgi:hypothetical protein